MTENRDQTQKAVMALRDLILSGDIKPGDRLSEPVLVEKLGLSRTPIRSALMRLELEGLTERIPTGGYATRQFDGMDIADAIELRGVLEGTAMRLAAERGASDEQINELNTVLDQIEAKALLDNGRIDLDAYIPLNDRFHQLIIECSSSNLLKRELERICNQPFAGPNAFAATHGGNVQSAQVIHEAQIQHRAIVDAIQRREGSRAEALGREHARLALRNLSNVMTNPALRQLLAGANLVKISA